MITKPRRRWLARVVCGISLALGAGHVSPCRAETPAACEAPAVKTLDLGASLDTAFDTQPNLLAARASMGAAQAQNDALQRMGLVAQLVAHDLPIRQKQAKLGLSVAHGGLIQAEYETYYAVTRSYYSVLYARAQQKVADSVVGSLGFYQKQVSDAVKEGKSRKWTTETTDKITIYLRLAQNKQAEAERGLIQANAALKEAIGLDPCCCIDVIVEELPEPAIEEICKGDIIGWALDRRGEMLQARSAAQIFCLEIEAQAATTCTCGVNRTFAAAGDIHAKVVPAGHHNDEYRPGALAPEMPVYLVGSKSDRVARARHFAYRAQAVADKTRNLITLEATDVYSKYLEAVKKVKVGRDGAAAGKRLAENTGKSFRADPTGKLVKIEDILTNEVLAAQAQSAYNEAKWKLLLALADLERVTAGGFCANFIKPAAEEIAPPRE